MSRKQGESDFHVGQGWYAPWRAAYLTPATTPVEIAGLPMLVTRGRLGPVGFRHLRSQTNVHTPRLDVATDPLEPDLASRLLANAHPDIVTIDYVAATSPLYTAALEWTTTHRATVSPQAAAPAADCRAGYADWLAARSKRSRARWPKLERTLIDEMGMTFEVLDGRIGLPALLDEILAVEQSGWKGRARTAIRDDPADTLFYTTLAYEAAMAGALRIAVLRHERRIVAFEYGVIGGDRAFLLKVGFDERFDHLSIGHVLATMHIRHCCEDPAIAWYDKLGNGMTPAPYKLRFADHIDILYRITLYSDGWRGRLLQGYDAARIRAKRVRDDWRRRATAA